MEMYRLLANLKVLPLAPLSSVLTKYVLELIEGDWVY